MSVLVFVSSDDVKASVMRVNLKKKKKIVVPIAKICQGSGNKSGEEEEEGVERLPTLTALSALPPSCGTDPAVRQPPLFLCLASLLCEGLGLLLLLLLLHLKFKSPRLLNVKLNINI